MALCLGESLLYRSGFDARDQLNRYCNWKNHGYFSSTGECFDVGGTVRGSLLRFESNGDPIAGPTDPSTAGNGSLMRLAPVVLYFFPDIDKVHHFSAESSRTTHGAPEAVECCELLAQLLCNALRGEEKSRVLSLKELSLQEPKVAAIALGSYAEKSRASIVGSGYAVASLEAAIWCLHNTASFREAILEAANLGDDADTTAAIVGQMAGAFYGVEGIPGDWLAKLYLREEIEGMADRLWEVATKQ